MDDTQRIVVNNSEIMEQCPDVGIVRLVTGEEYHVSEIEFVGDAVSNVVQREIASIPYAGTESPHVFEIREPNPYFANLPA